MTDGYSRCRRRGFTLVELVIIIVVTGILAAVIVVNFSVKSQHSAVTQADELRRNLSRIQLLAISQGARLKLTVTSTGYSVTSCPTSACTGAVADQATGLPFTVGPLDDGVTITSGTGDYFFDSLGRPVLAATDATLSPAYTNPLTVNGNGNCIDVTVLPVTGFASSGTPYAC